MRVAALLVLVLALPGSESACGQDALVVRDAMTLDSTQTPGPLLDIAAGLRHTVALHSDGSAVPGGGQYRGPSGRAAASPRPQLRQGGPGWQTLGGTS